MDLDYIIKNKVSEQDFEQIVYKWLAEGDYTPDDIIENIITQNNLALMPLYYSKDDYSGSCSVSLGYQKLVEDNVYDNVNKKWVRQSRWITEWQPHSQAIQGNTVTITYAGGKVINPISIFFENMGWKSEELLSIPPDAPRYDEMCNLFKVSKNDSWDIRGGKKAYNQAFQQTIPKLPSSIYNNLVLNIKFTETMFFNVLAPYWLFSYEYQEKQYYVLVDGNNPGRIDGLRPEDKKRKSEVIKVKWFGWLVGILATILALYIVAGQDFDKIVWNWTNFGIGLAGLILTGVTVAYEVVKIKDKSKKIRQQLLANKLKRLK